MNERDDEAETGKGVVSTIEESRPAVALANGVGAFVGGFVVFFAVIVATGELSTSKPVRLFKEVSQLFYNSFRVPAYVRESVVAQTNETIVIKQISETWTNGITGWTRIHEEIRVGGEVTREATRSGFVGVDTTLPELVYLLVPVVVLLAVGLAFGYRSLAVNEDTTLRTIGLRSLVGGAILTVGFLLVALLGTYVTVIEAPQAFRQPARLETLLYGFAYPAILGTVGIATGQYYHWRTATESSESGSERPGEVNSDDTTAAESDAEDESGEESN